MIKKTNTDFSFLPDNFTPELKIFLSEAVNYFPMPFLLSNKKNQIILANQSFCDELGYSQNELLGKDIFEYIKLNNQTIRTNIFKELAEKGIFENINITLNRSSENELSGIMNVKLIPYLRSELFLWSFLIDMTSEISTSQDEIDIQAYNTKLTGRENWSLELNTNKFYGTQQAYHLFGLNRKTGVCNLDVLLDQFSSLDSKNIFQNAINSLSSKKQSKILDIEVKVKNIENIQSGNRTILLNAGLRTAGDLNFITGTIDDISQLKRIQKVLKNQKRRAHNANKYKLAFLKNLSYEIRTPMNTIMGFSELLNQKDITEEKISEYTSLIRNKGKYLHTLIDDVIELSRFESEQVSLNKSSFELQPFLKELFDEFEILRRESQKDNLTLLLKVPQNLENQLIYTDPGRLHQLFTNLLNNAIKFTHKGIIEFGYKKSDKYFKFYVSDTGIGLHDEEKLKIFNRFEEMEQTEIKKFSGSGLNLTISKHIVELLGGKIKVKSEPNKGSKFQFSIPMDKVSKTIDNVKFNEWKERINWKDKVILIAEDEELNYRFLETILEKTNAQILRAKNGQEAIDLCHKIGQIDIVLMDIKMPVVNGYDAIIAIRKLRPNLPIIAQTAFAGHEEIIKCQNVGCNDYVTKPIDIKLLLSKIESQFNS